MRCIDADLINRDTFSDCENATECVYAIGNIPTADVQEVVHGKWLNFIGDFSTAECSRCGEIYEVIPDEKPSEEFFKAFNECYKFCSRCGAKMDRGDKMSTGNETLF